MAKKPETNFKEKVLAEIRKYSPVWAEKIQQRSLRGTPDILACMNGKFIALELKVDGEEPDPLQAHKLRNILLAGGTALTVTPSTWEDAWKSLRRTLKLYKNS